MHTQLAEFYTEHQITTLRKHLGKYDIDVPTEFLQLVGIARYFLSQAQRGHFNEYEDLLDYLSDTLDYYVYEGGDCFGYTTQVSYTVIEIDTLIDTHMFKED